MRIAIVDTTLTTSPTGGCQTFLEHLAPTLHGRGHQLTVLTEPGDDTRVADRIASTGVRVLDDVWPRRFLPEERALQLARWCRRESLDVYLVSVSRDAGWLALPDLDPTTRTAAVVHSDSPAFYAPLSHYSVFVDHAIGVSAETCRNIVARCGVPQSRTRRIPYGIERLSELGLAERLESRGRGRPLRVAYIGRLVQPLKRVQDLAPLVRELSRRAVPFEMHVIGSGEDGDRLRQELARSGVERHVRFWGWLEPVDVRARLNELDALVLLSEIEGLPLALLEAMGYGVVPVATRIPSGNVELVRDGENGFLAGVGDTAAFADHLERLQGDPSMLARLRRGAWLTSADYSVERMTSAYEACFVDDTERAPRAPGPFPVMPSCRSPYPRWLRMIRWRLGALRASATGRPRLRA